MMKLASTKCAASIRAGIAVFLALALGFASHRASLAGPPSTVEQDAASTALEPLASNTAVWRTTDGRITVLNPAHPSNAPAYFKAVARNDVSTVASYLDDGLSPYTVMDQDGRYGTALTFALIWQSDRVCDLVAEFNSRHIDVRSSDANGGVVNGTLMDTAVGMTNLAAIQCLRRFFPDVSPWIDFESGRIAVIHRLLDAADSEPVATVLDKCARDIRYVFFRPGLFNERHFAKKLNDADTSLLTWACAPTTTVGEFRSTLLQRGPGEFDLSNSQRVLATLER